MIQLLMLDLVLFGILLLPVFFLIYWHNWKKRKSSTPLKKRFLRGPGQSVACTIEDLELRNERDLVALLTVVCAVFLGVLAEMLFRIMPEFKRSAGYSLVLLILMLLWCTVYLSVKIWFNRRERAGLRRELEGRIQVGQGLNRLFLSGARVYHDFPTGDFYIDHVVVSPAGVYAVDTVVEQKPVLGKGAFNSFVVCDGSYLKFPHRTDDRPMLQARLCADWLSDWLSSEAGEPVCVRAVVAVPGWVVGRCGNGSSAVTNPVIYNGENPSFMVESANGDRMADPLFMRVVNSLESRARTVITCTLE